MERVRSLEALEALEPEWAELDAQQSPRTPFSSPTWNLLWWRHFAERRFAIRDELFAHIVRDATGRLIAVAPMVLTRRPGVGLVAARAVQFFGADANVTEVRGMVCHPEYRREAMTALSEHLLRRSSRWDWVLWHGARGDESAWGALAPGLTVQQDRPIPDYYLDLPATWDELRAGLSRNIKESLRKCYNSLKRDGHSFVFRAIERPEEARAAIQKFFDLHAARASAVDTIQHADVFGAERPRAFLLEFAERMAREGKLRVFQLDIGGVIVATRVGFLLGDELYLYFSGYDEAWAKYSVMTTVVAEAIKWAIEHHVKVVNLSPGKDVSKLRWSPKEHTFRDGVLLSTGPRGQLVYRAFHAVRDQNPDNPLASILRALRRGR